MNDYFDVKLYSIQVFNQSFNWNYSSMTRIYLHDAEYEENDLILE